MSGKGSIIDQPVDPPVHKDGKVVTILVLIARVTEQPHQRVLFRFGFISIHRVGEVEDRGDIEDLMVFCPLTVNQIISSNLSNPKAPAISHLAFTLICPLCNQLFKLLFRLVP